MGALRFLLRTLVRIGSLGLCLFALNVTAQNETDALRLSSISPGGTARSIGLANAFGALGADGVSIAINPAGMGLFRTSEISLTPGFDVNNVRSNYYGTSASNSMARFYLGNFTLALNSPNAKDNDWRSSTFGLVYDRQATHHWSRQATASGIQTSILDDFAWQAEGKLPDELYGSLPFTSALAWETYGLDPYDPSDSLGRSYVPALPIGGLVDQTHTIESHGATSNTSFFYSGNYMDRFYFGVSLGIIGFRYNEVSTHAEAVPDDSTDLKDLSYRQELKITGNGLDLKAGFIVRITDRFRTGLAIHGPMWTQLNDLYSTDMRTTFRTPSATDGQTNYSSVSPENVFAYRLNSPWKVVASAAYIAGKHGLVSVDHEYIDHRNARFRPSNKLVDNYDFATENLAINNSFRAVHAVRAGTEWRSGNWYFRMGWGMVPDAYKKDDPRHGSAERIYAGGLGFRNEHLGVDLGMNYTQRTTNYFQYDPALVDVTQEKRSTVRTLVTVSLRP